MFRHFSAIALLAPLVPPMLPASDVNEPPVSWKACGDHGAVVTGERQAADAAIRVLHHGNAADAAVTALLMLSVTDSGNFCFGDEVPIMVYDAKRNVVEVLCGQGAAPRLATLDYFEPGKRPRNTLTPTLVLRQGKPILAISVAGGDQQDQVTLQLLLDHLEFGLFPAEAVTAPRFVTNHHVGSFNQTPPQLGSLLVYESLGKETIDALAARGHHVRAEKPPFGAPVMLVIDPGTGYKQAAGDPQAGRHARAY